MTIGIQDASIYNDLSGLNSIKRQASDNPDEALKQVAKQFESMFVQMMMKSMREANAVFEEGGLSDSNESQFYRDMYDQQLALTLSSGKGVGIADALYRQLKGNYGDILDLNDQAPEAKSISEYFNNFIERSKPDLKPTSLKDSTDNLSDPQTLNQSFGSPEEFVEKLKPVFEPYAKQLGLNVDYLLSQSALETGWGKFVNQHGDGRSSFNLFNIKADERWTGDSVKVTTTEFKNGHPVRENANFRSYQSYEESLEDYVRFLSTNDRYSEALENTNKPNNFFYQLQNSGYATDPNYARKVIDVAERVQSTTVSGNEG